MGKIKIIINETRFREDFEKLSSFGKTPNGGVNRPAFSTPHITARQWLKERAQRAGLDVRQDAAGNQIIRYESLNPKARTLILGSHLDSVPNGGKYDGALGVLAGLEVLRVIKENNIALPFHLEAIDFSDEEGTLVSFLGSFAMSGKLRSIDLQYPRGGLKALQKGLKRANIIYEKIPTARRQPNEIAGYLEIHIEQGPILEQAGISIGIVSKISGLKFFELSYLGRAHHAGTTPIIMRRDAGFAAADFILNFYKKIIDEYPDCLGNVGRIQFEPGEYNIVPAIAKLAIELRSPEEAILISIAEEMAGFAQSIASQHKVEYRWEELGERRPVVLDKGLQEIIAQVAHKMGLKTMPIISGAGHDAQSFADICPTGMIFIPSRQGISHAEDEYSEWADCVRGTNLFLQVVLQAADYFEKNPFPHSFDGSEIS